MDLSEGVVAFNLIDTAAFPLKRRGIVEGRNVQWTSDPLPINISYPHQVRPPKPDHHYDYPPGRKFNWTDLEMAVLHHRKAMPYVQPTRDNTCPFLALEFKTEATGGVLYVAENQGAGSGVHMVASQRWLQHQAFPDKTLAATDSVSFVGAVSPRTCVFYIVWWSEKKCKYIMSKIRTISFMEGPDIQRCRDIVDNIVDYEFGERLRLIRAALAALDPIPTHWKQSRPASVISETPSASFDNEETRSVSRRN